ncbi:sulfotransferase [Marinobacter sp. M1N3S26]|uniref:sulfotransferase n=1 Tax=Marinobacter sp. M1N3S26 TaxID=3382299 RepID=UPI00387B4E9D
MKYLCSGWNRTGTTTMGSVFKKLGGKHVTFSEELFDCLIEGRVEHLLDVASNADSADDFPFNILYPELKKENKDLKVVHTYVRDPEVWIKRQKTLALRAPTKRLRICNLFLYGKASPFGNEKSFIDRYLSYNNEVLSFFEGDPNFIKVDLTDFEDKKRLSSWIEVELNHDIGGDDFTMENVTKKPFSSYSLNHLQTIKHNVKSS